MNKFTKEEISLCKQVIEWYEKEIEFGDWYYEKDSDDIFLCEETNGQYVFPNLIPLWTISDCLEFLKSKTFYGRISDIGANYEAVYKKTIIGENDEDLSKVIWIRNTKTPLEACLKAVLAVLEEEK